MLHATTGYRPSIVARSHGHPEVVENLDRESPAEVSLGYLQFYVRSTSSARICSYDT